MQSTSTETPHIVFVSPAKQKRDMCIAFPAAALSSSTFFSPVKQKLDICIAFPALSSSSA